MGTNFRVADGAFSAIFASESHMDEFLTKVLEQVHCRTMSVEEAKRQILQEMGRGGRILVMNEDLRELEQELSILNYTTTSVPRHLEDTQIKGALWAKIIITRSGRQFVADLDKYYYGLIWIQSDLPWQKMAKKIESTLVSATFKMNLAQAIKL